MKRIAYELYDPCLTIKENADKLSCSVASLKKHFKIKGIDRKFDGYYVRWKQIQDFFYKTPNASLRQASAILGYSINTLQKYRTLSEEELYVSKRDMEKVSFFDIKNKNSIKTISYDQTEILSWIMRLYNNRQPFDCD